MTGHAQRQLFAAVLRVMDALSPARRGAAMLSDWLEDADPEFDWTAEPRRAQRVDRATWQDLRKRVGRHLAALPPARPDRRARTLATLGQLAGISPAETAILDLVLRSGTRRGIGGLCDLLCDDLRMDRETVLVLLADVPPRDAWRALSGSGRLHAAGLLERSCRHHDDALGLCAGDAVSRLLAAGCTTPGRMRRVLFPNAPAPVTDWGDFDHVAPARDLALRTLQGACATGQAGVNILFHGPPGTGKTELCKALAARLRRPLLAIGETDDDGDPPSTGERSGALRLAQILLAPDDPSLLLFDEMEDMLDRSALGLLTGHRSAASKVHLHRMLETNARPVLWTINDVGQCDPALLRRMTLAIPLPVPGPRVRERVWSRLADRAGLDMPAGDLARISDEVPLPPALVASALTATRLAGGDAADLHRAARYAAATQNGGQDIAPVRAPGPVFDPALVVTDTDLAALCMRIAADDAPRALSFLLDGPPGTGKSALARHFAAVMGLPVIQKRASDLLSPFVGQTEAAIATAFAAARADRAMLIFDEADSLLSDRARARATWEVSQVNEMLTWMESHPLPFACTTNLAARLDPATRRRFTLPITLQPLDPPRLVAAYRALFAADPPAGLDQIAGLTPGDLVTARRRLSLLGVTDPAGILADLRAESAAKGISRQPAGFVPRLQDKRGRIAT